MKKRVFSIITICLMILSLSLSAFAHSGRTDSSGGHKDNKNKSGLGSYHYHCGGYPAHLHTNGRCPYTDPKPVYATSITAKNVPSKIDAGETATLEASVYPSNAEDKTISWESSDTSVLTVSSTGSLTAVGVGTATITAKTSRGTSKKFTITVNEVMAESISIANNDTEILIEDTQALDCEFSPENTTDKTIVWTTSDESVISVSEDGEITANKLGTATITATHKELTDSIDIEVKPIDAESIEIVLPDDTEANDNGTPKVNKGSEIQLKAEVLPENTTYKDIEWSVSDETIATIDETVVLLSKGEVDSKKIRVEFSLEDMDMSEFQDGATYTQIKDYVLEHSGLKVSNLYISQIKRKCGIEVGKNYNLPKSEDSRQPLCPPEKEKAIREAFKYFGII